MKRLDFIKTLLFGAVAAKALPKSKLEQRQTEIDSWVTRDPEPSFSFTTTDPELVKKFFATSDVEILWPINGNFGKITSFELIEAKLK